MAFHLKWREFESRWRKSLDAITPGTYCWPCKIRKYKHGPYQCPVLALACKEVLSGGNPKLENFSFYVRRVCTHSRNSPTTPSSKYAYTPESLRNFPSVTEKLLFQDFSGFQWISVALWISPKKDRELDREDLNSKTVWRIFWVRSVYAANRTTRITIQRKKFIATIWLR